jgi:hypothetical protein
VRRAVVLGGLVLASASRAAGAHGPAAASGPASSASGAHGPAHPPASASSASGAHGAAHPPASASSASGAHAPSTASAASHGPPAPHPVPLPPLPPPRVVRAAPPLPMLPSIARVRVDAGRDRLVVTEDVSLPRGEWQSGEVDVFVAFGAPGVPIALDARLLAASPAPTAGDEGAERLATEPSVRRDPASAVLVGRPLMAGVVVRVRESQLRRAFASSDDAVVRVRSLVRPPSADGSGGRDVVVRLGVASGEPMTLGRIEVASLDGAAPIRRASATLCGAEADPWPLAVVGAPTDGNAIAPPDAVRHATDDLCIRWW